MAAAAACRGAAAVLGDIRAERTPLVANALDTWQGPDAEQFADLDLAARRTADNLGSQMLALAARLLTST